MTREKRLESMLIIAAGFIALFFIFKIKWFLLTAFTIAFLGAMSKPFTQATTWLWFKLSEGLGWINARILLGIIFFLILFPISLLMRLFNKNVLKLKKQTTSYYTERNHTYTNEDLENVW